MASLLRLRRTTRLYEYGVWKLYDFYLCETSSTVTKCFLRAPKLKFSRDTPILYFASTSIPSPIYSSRVDLMRQSGYGLLLEVRIRFLHGFGLGLTFGCSARPIKTLPAHSDPVTSVTFNHDGALIASCAMDGLMYELPSPYCHAPN